MFLHVLCKRSYCCKFLGTMAGAIDLIRKAEGRVVGSFFLIELTDLHGRQKFADVPSYCLLNF